MKKTIRSLSSKTGLAAAALLAAMVFISCQSLSSVFREPLLSLNSVDLADISFIGAKVLCKVNVENPNAFDIPFPEIDWELHINANSFINGKIKADQSIKARRTTVVEVPVGFNYLEVFNTFNSLKGSSQADYKIVLAAQFALPLLGDKVWNFEHTGILPLLQVPAISFAGISVKSLGLTSLDFDVVWEIENNNSFAMSVNDFSYDLRVNNTQWAGGRVSGAPQIEANRITRIPLTISINSLSMISEITEIIARGTDVSYICSGNMNLGAALPGLDDFSRPFNFAGTTRLRR